MEGTWTVCSRGHRFLRTKARPTCPTCWPGRYEKSADIHRHTDGTPWSKGKMVNGKMDGPWIWYRKDGSKMRSGSFNKGKQTGKWTTYDRKGKVVKVTEFGKKR